VLNVSAANTDEVRGRPHEDVFVAVETVSLSSSASKCNTNLVKDNISGEQIFSFI
jgi:hypothetical protein